MGGSENGDIVYTKCTRRNLILGIIKANKGKNGIMSTLYAVYKRKTKCQSRILSRIILSRIPE